MNRLRRVLVVTPTFNSEQFLSESLRSVFSQASHTVRLSYHVQDGGSSDGTLAILQATVARLQQEPIEGLDSFSFASRPDRGMYEAINRSFEVLRPEDDDILTWINSDDLLAPGALATVVQVLNDIPQCRFLSGRVALLNAQGSVTTLGHPLPYARANLAAGLHDGRSMPFVMQEGTFFTGDLWKRVGGVNPSLRLAGDWDLWRRLAAEAEHFSIDTLTGFHRRHGNQLTNQLDEYYAEVDALLDADPVSLDAEKDQMTSNLVRYGAEQKHWVHIPFYTTNSLPADRLSYGRGGKGQIVSYISGFGPLEGPYPEFGLPMGVRWLVSRRGSLRTRVTIDGKHRCRIRLRSGAKNLKFTVAMNGRNAFVAAIPDSLPMKDEIVEFSCWLHEGWNTIDMAAEAEAFTARPALVIDTEIIADPIQPAPRRQPAPLSDLARMKIRILAAGESPAALADTLESLGNVWRGARRIVIGAESDRLTLHLLQAFASEIDEVIPLAVSGDENDRTQDFEETDLTLIIRAGDRLSSDLIDFAGAASGANARTTLGLIDLLDSRGAVIERRLPQAGQPPILVGLTSDSSESIDQRALGRTLVSRLGHAEQAPQSLDGNAPELWLLDRSGNGYPELGPLAAAFALLGVQARHVVINASDDAPWAAALEIPVGAILCNWRPSWSHPQLRIIDETPQQALLLAGFGGPVSLQPAIDLRIHAFQHRWTARAALGLPNNAFVILADIDGVLTALTEELSRASPTLIIVSLMEADPAAANQVAGDAALLPLWLAAADGLIADENGATAHLCLAARAAGLPRLSSEDLTQIVAIADDGAQGGLRTALQRELLGKAYIRGIEDLALDILAQPSIDWGQAVCDWLTRREHLLAAPVALRTGQTAQPSGAPDAASFYPSGVARLIPMQGVWADRNRGPAWPLSVRVAESGGTAMIHTLVPLTGLRLLLEPELTGKCILLLNGSAIVELETVAGQRCQAYVEAHIGVGYHRIEFVPADRLGALNILTWEALGHEGISYPIGDLERGTVVADPSGCRKSTTLIFDGDWQLVDGFYPSESAQPQWGLHREFNWSQGCRSIVRLRIGVPGRRFFRLAFTGVLPGQRAKLRIDDQCTEWSEPIDGVVGRFAFTAGILKVVAGDVDLGIEVSDSVEAGEQRHVGVIILGLEMSMPLPVDTEADDADITNESGEVQLPLTSP